MYRISQNHNKIPVETLEKWNAVTNDHLQAGMKLIVGYLKVKTTQSSLAATGLKKIMNSGCLYGWYRHKTGYRAACC